MLCEEGELSDLKRRDVAAEWKYDGTRVLIIKEDGKVRLQNRHGIDYTIRLPEIVQAANKIPAEQFILDGEAVYINPEGEIEFIGSQRRCATHFPDVLLRMKYPITHKCFDIIGLDGEDLTDIPFQKRKEILRDLLKGFKTIEYVDYTTDLENAWEEVKRRQEEGLILKRLDSRYEHFRSYNWIKVKNWRHEIVDVVGYTPGKNARSIYFGALVLAKDGKFRGCVGSGFNEWQLRKIKEELDQAEKIDRPFEIGDVYTAVKTDLKVKVKYYKITDNGVMRFPVFEGII